MSAVMVTEECPIILETRAMSVPEANNREARPWRRSCSRIFRNPRGRDQPGELLGDAFRMQGVSAIVGEDQIVVGVGAARGSRCPPARRCVLVPGARIAVERPAGTPLALFRPHSLAHTSTAWMLGVNEVNVSRYVARGLHASHPPQVQPATEMRSNNLRSNDGSLATLTGSPTPKRARSLASAAPA